MCVADETTVIEHMVSSFLRSSAQLNTLQHSDAELVRLNEEMILAVTTDSIAEEIEHGLYDDPYMIGWMTVAVNCSDIAAVGASPLGLLLNQTLTYTLEPQWVDEMQRGINDASRRYAMPVLGGDTNYSVRLHMSATAIGIFIHGRTPVQRTGSSPGDHLYASGRLGSGNAYAFQKLSGCAGQTNWFIPVPRMTEGALVSKYASSCMDTSDGLIAALDQLMAVNRFGFVLTSPPHTFLAADALEVCRARELPHWFMLAGPHGEFELLFTLPVAHEEQFLDEASSIGWQPLRLGTVTPEPQLMMPHPKHSIVSVDGARIRNIFTRSDRTLDWFLGELSQIEQNWRMQS
ncbi:MAG TPA: thiamine-phosphate kinase [Bacteroidota bacterium]|nr:thiamine-phosphate kinase [Bacteroidota bacterium]